MIKIKDDVDLKELEKFGFKNLKAVEGKSEHRYIFTVDEDEVEKILIFAQDRKIHIDLQVELFPFVKDEYKDKLYDLIQAGLVEKVKE